MEGQIQNKYQNGKIYKLVHDDKVIYVGSTVQQLNDRLSCHKGTSKLKPDRKIYKFISNVGWNNVDIQLVENYNCENRNELELRERYYIELLKPDLNTQLPTRTKNEWRNQNKNKVLEMKNKYYNNNKEKVNEWRKAKIQCCCGSNISNSNKALHERSLKHQNYIKQNNDNQVNI